MMKISSQRLQDKKRLLVIDNEPGTSAGAGYMGERGGGGGMPVPGQFIFELCSAPAPTCDSGGGRAGAGGASCVTSAM